MGPVGRVRLVGRVRRVGKARVGRELQILRTLQLSEVRRFFHVVRHTLENHNFAAGTLSAPAPDMTLRHHSLVAWQRADDLFITVHKLTRSHFPADERFELSSQARRAAYSVAANIVEGTAREHVGERVQFLRTAWSSLAEVGYCLHAAKRLGYIDKKHYDGLELEVRKAAAPLKGLMDFERTSKSNAKLT